MEPVELRIRRYVGTLRQSPQAYGIAVQEAHQRRRARGKTVQQEKVKPESTEGRPWGQPLKKAEGAPLNLG